MIFQGRRHAADTKALVAFGQRVLAATDGQVIPTVITTDNNTTSPGYEPYVLSDPGQRTHVSYGAITPSLYLIRPDGYVGFRCHAGEEAKLVNYLQRHYGIVGSTRAEALDACFC